MITENRSTQQADQAHVRWARQNPDESRRLFAAWLSTPAGLSWIQKELEIDEERQGRSDWEGW